MENIYVWKWEEDTSQNLVFNSVNFFFVSLLLKFSFFKIFIVIQLQLYAFSPHPSTPPQPKTTFLPHLYPPLDFVYVSFIVAPVISSPHYPLPTPLWLLLHCS